VCGYCRERPAEHIDHIIPAILHGMVVEQARLGVAPPSNNISNFMPACRVCNLAKGSRTPEQWRNGEPMIRRGDIEFPIRVHRRMGGPRDETIAANNEIIRLLDSGLSGADVARALDVHPATVTNARKWAGRPALIRQRRPPRLCEVPGCGRPHKARGFCQMHALRARRTEEVEP